MQRRPTPLCCPRCLGACRRTTEADVEVPVAFVALFDPATQRAQTFPRELVPAFQVRRHVVDPWLCTACGQFEVGWADVPAHERRLDA
jgi:hypothetical protein